MIDADVPDLIKTNIVNNSWDAYWQDTRINIPNSGKGYVLVITKPLTEGSNEETQLLKMLQACHLNKEDYYLSQIDEKQLFAWHKIKDNSSIKAILLVGIAPKQLGISALFQFNNVNSFDGCLWIPTAPAGELEKQRDIKMQLWTDALKPVFLDNKFGALK